MNIELNTIYNEDCLETMKRMPDNSIDLILTDPPYGLDKKLFQGGSKNLGWAMTKYKGSDWDKVPTQALFDEIFRVSKNQIIFGANYFSLPPSRGVICWDKMQYAPNFSQWEMAWTSFDKPAKIYKSSFMFDKEHPTQKPLDLFRRLVANYSKDSDTIYDPFMGSGTTARACKDLGRNYIGSEISKEYCEIAEQRLRQSVLL